MPSACRVHNPVNACFGPEYCYGVSHRSRLSLARIELFLEKPEACVHMIVNAARRGHAPRIATMRHPKGDGATGMPSVAVWTSINCTRFSRLSG
jgi:hypothetical protein